LDFKKRILKLQLANDIQAQILPNLYWVKCSQIANVLACGGLPEAGVGEEGEG